MPHTKGEIKALAASIAALGMLQSPVVEPESGARGKPTGNYLNAGEGRRLAQLLRVKRKEIRADEPIRCLLDTEHNGTEISLAENAIRCDMHPADQFEACAKLHAEDGMNAEDIGAFSEKLVGELTAYRTSALRNELANHPAIAFIALVHALALDVFFESRDSSCVQIAAKRTWLWGHAPGIDQSLAEQQVKYRHAAWGRRMPRDTHQLWSFIHGLSETERLALLAQTRAARRANCT